MNCKVKNCNKEGKARDLCIKHYSYLYKRNLLHLYPKNKISTYDKIMKLIKKQDTPLNGTPVKKNGKKTQCWIYTGTCPGGYGQIREGYKRIRVHRYIYWYFFLKDKDIELGKELICHKCDISNCCNPQHLFIGTSQENNDDMVKKGRNRNVKGEDCNNKLTEIQVKAIRLESGTHQNIAEKYGVCRQTVGLIKSFKRWGWLK